MSCAALAGAFANGFEDARLGDTAEIVADGRPPARRHHVEAGLASEPVCLRQSHVEAMAADARTGMRVRPLEERVDAVAHAQGEQVHARAVIEMGEPVPEGLVVGGDMVAPAFMPLVYGACGVALLQLVGLSREEDVPDTGLEAARRRSVPEGVADQLVQQHRHGDPWIFRHGVAQRHGAMSRQLDHESFGQGLEAVVLVLLRFGRLASDGDDRALDRRRIAAIGIGLIAAAFGFDWSLILWAHIASLDQKRTVRIEADEDAGDADLGRIVGDGPPFEGFQSLLDLAKR